MNDPVWRSALSPQDPFGVVHATVPGVLMVVAVLRKAARLIDQNGVQIRMQDRRHRQ